MATHSQRAAARLFIADAGTMLLVVLAAACLLVASNVPLQTALVDDAYIFQRVADNIRAGHGWTYNPGSSVNPITSPFYAGVLLLANVILPFDAAMVIVVTYLAGLCVLAWVVFDALKPVMGRPAAGAAAVVACIASVPMRSWGMETSWFLATLALAVHAFSKGRDSAAGLWCACAALSRPEGLALVGILGLWALFVERRIAWRLLPWFLAITVPWFAYSMAAHGRILPNSVAVKSIQHGIGWFKEQPTWLLSFLSQPRWPWITWMLVPAGAILALKACRQRHTFLALVALFATVQVIAYSIKSAPVGYFWYYAPGNLAVDLLVLLALWSILDRGLIRLSLKGKLLPELVVAGLLVVLLGRLGAAPMHVVKPVSLGTDYTAAGNWIREHTPGDAVVALTEIGYVGHFSKREIRDIHGLIHPESIPSLQKERWDWWFQDQPPDVIVVHRPGWTGEPTHAHGWKTETLERFNRDYVKARSFGELDVFIRKDASHASADPT